MLPKTHPFAATGAIGIDSLVVVRPRHGDQEALLHDNRHSRSNARVPAFLYVFRDPLRRHVVDGYRMASTDTPGDVMVAP